MARSADKSMDQAHLTASTTPGARSDKKVLEEDGYPGDGHSESMAAPPAHNAHLNRAPTGLFSEHGHSLGRIQPMSKHSGSSVSTFFNGVFTSSIGIATLGASITFSYVLSNNDNIAPSHNPFFNTMQIQEFLAISWLLFLLALGFASLGSTFLTFFKGHWMADWDGLNGRTSQWSVQMYAVCSSGLLGGLIISAFILLCLVVVAYSEVVGWIALGFTSFFGLVIALAIINQAPWPWRDNTPSSSARQHTA